MDSRNLSRTTGSVVLQVGALEWLARYSMNSGRATSALSSLHEFRTQEAEQVGGKQWNWKYLRDQFDQKDLEGLYRKYDDKLRETLIYIYISLLILFSTIHIVLVIIGTYSEQIPWHSTYLSMIMYILRITIPTLFLWKGIYEPMKRKWFWIPIFVTFVITVDLVATDIVVAIYSSFEGMRLRPAYSTMSLLSVYIFLPMRNNYLAIVLGVLVSVLYVLVFAFFTYVEDSQMVGVVASDVVYLVGVNLMGVYFRLMNEIVTRRSFLDRRACVESTLRLKFVKDQEERLMLSILPEHIVSRVREDVRTIILGIQSRNISQNLKSFNHLYVEEHDNVSILYADVVNYTMISTTLSPMRMVELLNELFGRFDEASEEHDVLRIKFLGDCYYCVSGVPKPNLQHAKNCVDLGLEMIHIIKDVREKRSLNIDMRIGVHSGRILSGLIGIRKWQYDIWSKDVTIANKMESTGKAGKVHVTKQTLELLLDYAREYIIEPNFESQNNPFIIKHKLETYLLSRPQRPPIEYKPFRRASVGFNKIIKKSSRRSESRNSTNFRRTTTFMDENLVEYQQMLKAADAQMAKEIEDMTKGSDYYRNDSKFNAFTLMYNNCQQEKTFLLLPDPLFKYYMLCCLIIFILILLINALTTNWLKGFQWWSWTIFGILLIFLIALQPLTWFQFLWNKYRGIDEPRNEYWRKIYDISSKITKSAQIRTVVYILVSLGLAATSIVNVISCTEVEVKPASEVVLSNCVSSWHVTQCWGLALLLNFLFSRVFFIFKWIVAGGMTMFYLWVVWEIKSALFQEDTTWNVGLDPRISHTLSVVFITMTLYWIDRTTEYRNRLDHLWQMQLSEEQKEAETMLKVNNMLLENILPAHVVQIYLDLNRSIDELYYEKYDNVAVMFASLTDYKLGIEDDMDLSDKFFLSILDEVISDFDRLLLTGTSTYKVEKIKMAGWTYMAACGLDPNRRESFDSSSYTSTIPDRRQNTPYNRAIVLTMVEFAAAMMMQLQNFNRGSFQSFEGMNLRIGISNGEVAAGVVGSLKPLYDIWGHAVNMASRMDSTGDAGKIQVTENTAKILDDCGILTTYRGETFVKGAGYIRTYFVPLDEDFNLIKKDKCMIFYRTEDRNRYYNVKNEILLGEISSDIADTDVISEVTTYDARVLSIDCDSEEYDDDLKDMSTITPTDIDNDDDSYISTDPEVIETSL
ncbi:adenylate cyclase type 2-like isoform X2 [Pectinophora gossypiella]|uniref:adenylate cyclase type 2-like isoform X2 n=1 Tax=Pectinophora gossypiella TaxID=13191 RepID=UPI00214F41C6|nr:adenylate cyclase type 2-like isoform X2 [Pectinophora gossypiella]